MKGGTFFINHSTQANLVPACKYRNLDSRWITKPLFPAVVKRKREVSFAPSCPRNRGSDRARREYYCPSFSAKRLPMEPVIFQRMTLQTALRDVIEGEWQISRAATLENPSNYCNWLPGLASVFRRHSARNYKFHAYISAPRSRGLKAALSARG